MVSYVPKRNKAIILLPTMHHDAEVHKDTGDEKKPEMITFYNLTKTGVDVVNQLCASYISVEEEHYVGHWLCYFLYWALKFPILVYFSTTQSQKTVK
jgi:HJR/Mrr/RecB family endonuclease